MQRQDLVPTSADPMLVPEAAHRFAQQALREHQRAEKNVMKAVEHAVKAGQALLKAYDLCEWGQWEAFFQLHFPQHEEKRLSLRTARDYMNLARNWSRLCEKHPAGFSSQRQAMKALAAIIRADKSDPEGANSAARCRIGEDATASGATELTPARSQTQGQKKRSRTGPVWRASGPFVKEALRLVRSINDSLTSLISKGYPLREEAENVNAALARLQQMIDTDLDECEAQQARGEMIWVREKPARGSARRDGKRGTP